MHHRRWVGDERPAVAQICNQRDHLDAVHKLLARLVAALEAESEQRARALRAVLLVQIKVRAAEPRVAHPTDFLVLLEELGNCQGVVAMLLHAQREGLHAHRDQKGVERANAHAHVPQAKHARCDDEGNAGFTLRTQHLGNRAVLAEGLIHPHAVVGVARLRDYGELARRGPIEVAFLHDEATHSIAVPTQPLRRTVHHDVSAMFEWPSQVGRGRGVVHDQRQAVAVRDVGQPLQVNDQAPGIGDGLAVDRLRLGRDRLLDALVVLVPAERHRPSELLKLAGELRHGATVKLVRSHEVVSVLHDVAEAQQLSRVPARHRQGPAAALEGRDLVLERVARRVRDPRVDRAEGAEGELGGGVRGVLEDETRAHRDRTRPSACRRVRLLTCVQTLRGEARIVRAAPPEGLGGHRTAGGGEAAAGSASARSGAPDGRAAARGGPTGEPQEHRAGTEN
mmetsp:Transcript_127099/g.321138  ORF Transcript_127099/g.321138 Transcript_127099/m.321138 type:complete len:452 (-) Transcript_127099:2-1357(-)